MLVTILLSWAMIGQAQTLAPSASADLDVYRAAKSKLGHEANAHVQLALWCEAHGLTSERMEQLAQAVMRDPRNAVARGLLGLVSYQGRWQPALDVEKQIREDPAYQDLIREYLNRRDHTPEKADSQLKLAAWCNEKGLKEQAGRTTRPCFASIRPGRSPGDTWATRNAVIDGSSPKRPQPSGSRLSVRSRPISIGRCVWKSCRMVC